MARRRAAGRSVGRVGRLGPRSGAVRARFVDRRVEGEEALSAVDAIATYFKFSERGTTLATEVKAGVTTFMVMAYILFLNPAILSNMFGRPGRPRRPPRSRPSRRRRP